VDADARRQTLPVLGLERIVQDALSRGESAADLYDRYGVL